MGLHKVYNYAVHQLVLSVKSNPIFSVFTVVTISAIIRGTGRHLKLCIRYKFTLKSAVIRVDLVFVALRYGSMPILGLGLLQVRAGESPGEDMTPTTLVKPKDFPVYSEPKQTEYQLIPEGPSALRDMVGSVREQIWRFSDTFHGAISFTQRTYKTAEETSKSVIQFIKTEEGFYPRAGVISIAGLAGLVLARKGGFIRKVVYSGGLMTATASLCYPYQAVRIGKAEIEWVKTKAADLYKGDTSSPAVEKVAATEVKKEDESESSNQEDSLKTDEITSNASLEDHGQSKPEDKDMYTTRS